MENVQAYLSLYLTHAGIVVFTLQVRKVLEALQTEAEIEEDLEESDDSGRIFIFWHTFPWRNLLLRDHAQFVPSAMHKLCMISE